KSLFLSVLFAGGLSACSSDRTRETGFFLGYHGAGVGYRTLWISVTPTEAKVVADVPDLIIRRSSGFWRVGLSAVCDTTGSHEVVWHIPVGSTPQLPSPLCPVPATPGASDTLARGSGDASPPPEAEQPRCNADEARILFGSASYVEAQYTTVQTEECEP